MNEYDTDIKSDMFISSWVEEKIPRIDIFLFRKKKE
jgi:hypothetical protein